MSDTHSGQEDEERKSRGSEQGEPETLGFLGEELENSEASHFSFVRSVEHKEGEQEEGNNKEEVEQSAERTASEPVEGHKAGKQELTGLEQQKTDAKEEEINGKDQKKVLKEETEGNKEETKKEQHENSKDNEKKANSTETSTDKQPNHPIQPLTSPKTTIKPTLQLQPQPKQKPSNPIPQPSNKPLITNQVPPQPPSLPKSPRHKTQPTIRKDPSTRQSELRQLVKHNFSRKRQNYTKLKVWDEKRAEQLALHKAVLEELQLKVDKAIKSSIENLEIYISFLREKSKQEEKYATHPIINTRFATQNNDISKNIYINCTLLLNSLSDENVERSKKAQNFAYHIRKTILNDNLEEHLKKTQVELVKIRQKISTLKAALHKANNQTQQKTIKLATHFNSDQSNITLHTSKDFFKSQLSFLRRAHQQTRIQKRLGQFIYEYLKTAMDEEFKRAGAIKKAISEYIKGLRTAYDVEFDEESLEQLKKQEEEKLIPEFYAVEELLDGKLVYLVKEEMKMEESRELNMDALHLFFQKFNFTEFDDSLLISKSFQITHEVAKGKSQSAKLFLTVDNFLHLFFNSEHTTLYVKPSATFKLDKTLQITVKSDLGIELKKKEEKKGVMSYLLWDTKVQEPAFMVRFRSLEEREEFEEWVGRVM